MVKVGKIAPYVVIGYIQLGVILAAAWGLFKGNGAAQRWSELWPMLAFLLLADAVAFSRYLRMID